jgi:hypothetical protein
MTRAGLTDRLRSLLGRGSGAPPGDGNPQNLKEARKQLREARRKLSRSEERNAALRKRLASVEAGERAGGVRPENVVWVFGSGRTGSSWLTFMMGALPDHTRWNEPLVGYLFGHLYYSRALHRQSKDHFILADEYRHQWMSSARDLVLRGGAERFPERLDGGYLVIKEPHGSMGAPLLAEAVPESRLIFLVRDPRDVISSAIAASYIPTASDQSRRRKTVEEHPVEFATARTETYVRDIDHASKAFEAHGGPKAFVRYEDLRADPLGTMKRIYSELDIPVDADRLARVVHSRTWENVPEEQKGPDKRRRKARPGGWKEDLTPGQVEAVERISAPLLERFYPA